MHYYILMGKHYKNNHKNKIYLNETQLNLERYGIISINCDVYVSITCCRILHDNFCGEFYVYPASISTMDGLTSSHFYKLRPSLIVEKESQLKLFRNLQKVEETNCFIINENVHTVFKKHNIEGYLPQIYKPLTTLQENTKQLQIF